MLRKGKEGKTVWQLVCFPFLTIVGRREELGKREGELSGPADTEIASVSGILGSIRLG